jgi:YidC/Oxa1 family membrane protein insertase
MDTQRLILFFVFVFSTFMLIEGWQRDQKQQAPVVQGAGKGGTKDGKTDGKGDAGSIPVPQVPQGSISNGSSTPAATAGAAPVASVAAGGEIIKVETDVLLAQISTKGGDIRRLEFKQHKGTLDKTKNFVLFQSNADNTYIAQSGLIGLEGLPDHRTTYTVSSRDYKLADGAPAVEVRLEAPEANGVKVAQVYKFTRASYVIDVTYEITNGAEKALQPFGYFQLVRDRKPPDGDSAMLPTYTGLAVYTKGEKFQKVAFDDVDKAKTPYSKTSQDEGWIAIIQHYFLSAFLPKDKTPREFSTLKLENGLYVVRAVVTGAAIAAGQKGVISTPLYAGPQDTRTLETLAPDLDLVVDFGILTVIAKPLFKLLTWIQSMVGNWGIAIILLTVLIKALFYPLQAASYKAMAKMKVIAPKMQQLKERYGDDRQRMQKAMMELYQKEKVNPMAGCLPIVVQMPVFIALYWVILAAVELRHAPFYGWITDLSSIDPWYILPVLMGASMIIQTRLNPEPPDPVQAKVMKIMPIAFSVFFFFFPAGLVLYWLVNNILSIAQQWQINGAIERSAQKPGNAKS